VVKKSYPLRISDSFGQHCFVSLRESAPKGISPPEADECSFPLLDVLSTQRRESSRGPRNGFESR
jgi:hypothetical protein